MRFLKKLREDRHLTRYEMSRKIGIDPPAYYYLEDSGNGCKLRTLLLIKKASGLTWKKFGELIEEEGE